MADTPEIKVRLSPEGMSEVIAALRKVRSESGGAASSAAKDVGVLNRALGSLKSLLPTIGIGAVVAGIALIGRSALNSAEHLNKLQQSLGGTVEDLSALSFGAALADVEQAKLEQGMVRLVRSVGDLRRGTAENAEAFAELGLSARDFVGKDAVGAFELVAKGIAAETDELKKLHLTNEIFGKGSAALIPLLNAVGKEGFASLRAEAERLGLVMSTDLAKAAEDVNDHFTIIGKRSEALAIQFLSGFVGPLSEGLAIFRAGIEGDGGDAIKKLGEFFGELARDVLKLFLILNQTIAAVMASAVQKAQNLGQVAKNVVKDAATGAATGAVAGGAAGAAFFGVGAVPGAIVGAKAGAIVGAVNGLTKSVDQGDVEIWKKYRDEVEKIILATDPAQLGPNAQALKDLFRAGRGAGGGDDAGLATFNVRERLAALTKKLNLESIKDLQDLLQQREKLDAAQILAERRLADAKVAANAQTIEGQKRIADAEAALLAERAKNAGDAAKIEIAAAQAKEALLLAAVKRQFGETANAQRLATEVTLQSNREQLAAETKRYQSLVVLQNEHLQRERAMRQQITALDKEIADNRKSREEFANEITLAGLDEEGKKNFQFRQAQEALDRLRSATLAGDLEKMKEARREAVALAQDLRRLGDSGAAERVANDAAELFELGAQAKKLAAQGAADEAKKAAAGIDAQLKEIKDRIDQFTANLVFEVKPVVGPTQLADLVKQIQGELGKEPFQIAVRAAIQSAQLGQGTVIGVPGFAAGGRIPGFSPGPTADDKLLWGTSGEWIMQVPAVQHYGAQFMRDVNEMNLPRFAEGGMVGGGAAAGAGLQPVNIHVGGRSVRVYTHAEKLRELEDALNAVAAGT